MLGELSGDLIRPDADVAPTMDREAVQEYVDETHAVIEASPQLDEANTKAAILQSGFLDLLDWEIPTNTRLEYSVNAFGQTYKADYALVLEEAPVAFIEAKGADTPLTDDHDEQLSSYMTNQNVSYGILTNGREYRFFRRLVHRDDVSVQRIADVSLDELPDRTTLVEAYTVDAIESGATEQILERLDELREAHSTLQAEKDALATTIAEELTDTVSESIASFAESRSKELIDGLIADIDAELDNGGPDDGTVKVPDVEGTTPEPGQAEQSHLVGTISRAELDGDEDPRVAVFPMRKSGLQFLKENNAWGFVKAAKEFDYVAMYVSEDVQEIRYVARVKDVVSPDEVELARPAEEYADGEIDAGKLVVRFEPESLYELANPIPFETKYPQSLRYTTLGALREAETTDDLL